MKKSILILGETLNKAQQQQINGGSFPSDEVCKIAISIDKTLCLCTNWEPDGSGFCIRNNK